VGQDHGKGGLRGYDGGKRIKGRQGHLLVDTQGLVWKVKVHAAGLRDKEGAQLLAPCWEYSPGWPRSGGTMAMGA
jgi:putative transposase